MTPANWLTLMGLIACLLGAFAQKRLQSPSRALQAYKLPEFGSVAFRERLRGYLLRHSWDAVWFGFLLQIVAQFL